jgi:hypothetical protein
MGIEGKMPSCRCNVILRANQTNRRILFRMGCERTFYYFEPSKVRAKIEVFSAGLGLIIWEYIHIYPNRGLGQK